MITKGKAFAKVNLFLHVEKKLPNNYHTLNSLVCFTKEIYDEIYVFSNNKFELELINNHDNISFHENLIFKAYKFIIKNFNIDPSLQNIKIILKKNIPISAGLGGGSADAALTLKLLSKLWKLDENKIFLFCKELGADIPVCFTGKTSVMSGIGEKIQSPIILPKFYILIINPCKALSTKEVFENNLIYNNSTFKILSRYNESDFVDLLNNTSNTLEEAAMKILPEIKLIKDIISIQNGCIISRMSGSGASVIGIFLDKILAEQALCNIQIHYKQWWVKLSTNL